MPKLYIEAYYENGGQKLGNLDGQGVLRAKFYKRTKHYKALRTFPTLNNCTAFYKIVTEDGRLVEIVKNRTFQETGLLVETFKKLIEINNAKHLEQYRNQTRRSAMIDIHKGNY